MSSAISKQPLIAEDAEVSLDMSVVRPEVDATIAAEAEGRRKSRLLVISFILMIFVGLGNKIFQVLMLQPMVNYPLYVSMLTTAVYLPACFAYIWPMIKWGTQITPDQQAIPKKLFFYMGFLDALAGIIQTISVNYIANGTLVFLVTQMAIPISMALSKWLLKTKYKTSQYVGCLIVAAGLATVLIPKFMPKDGDSGDSCEGPKNSDTVVGLSIVGLVLSAVPMCLSSVVKERALGERNVDAIYLNGWVAVFQFLMSWPLLIPSAPMANVKIADIGTNLVDGAKCGIGINTIVPPSPTPAPTLTDAAHLTGVIATIIASASANGGLSSNFTSSLTPVGSASQGIFTEMSVAQVLLTGAAKVMGVKVGDGSCDDTQYDDCGKAPLYIAAYIVFNLFYNLLIIYIIKFGSANVLWLAMTIMVPLGSISFSLPFMPKHKSLEVPDIIGLIVILGGLITYRFFTQIRIRIWGKTDADRQEEIDAEAQAVAQTANLQTTQATVSPALSSRSGSQQQDESYYEPAVEPSFVASDQVALDDEVDGKKKKNKKGGRR